MLSFITNPTFSLMMARRAFLRLMKTLEATAEKAECQASKRLAQANKLKEQAGNLTCTAGEARRMKQNIARLIGTEE